MANEEQLAIVNRGAEVWNEWRNKNPNISIDLDGAMLIEMDLAHIDLQNASLVSAELDVADLRNADLKGATLVAADLGLADLSAADLSGAILDGAYLYGANLCGAILNKADFTEAEIGYTSLVDVDLSQVVGLDEVKHLAPSSIGIDTIYKSKGIIPVAFLRGCGVPEEMIDFVRRVSNQVRHFYSCFISYSSKDEAFAKRLHADLRNRSVRVWFAPENLKIGEKFRMRIDEAIKEYDKLLLVLSKNSVHSSWVEKEVEAATEKEARGKRVVLFPIRLDNAVMETDQAWAADIRRTRHIGDFTGWKEHDMYQKAFERLMRDLKASETL